MIDNGLMSDGLSALLSSVLVDDTITDYQLAKILAYKNQTQIKELRQGQRSIDDIPLWRLRRLELYVAKK